MYQALILGGAVFLGVQHIGMAVGLSSLEANTMSDALIEERKKIAGISYGVAAGLVLLYALYTMNEAKSVVVLWSRRVAAMFFIFFLTALGVYMCIPKEEPYDHQAAPEEQQAKKDVVQGVHIAAFTMAVAATFVATAAKF